MYTVVLIVTDVHKGPRGMQVKFMHPCDSAAAAVVRRSRRLDEGAGGEVSRHEGSHACSLIIFRDVGRVAGGDWAFASGGWQAAWARNEEVSSESRGSDCAERAGGSSVGGCAVGSPVREHAVPVGG